MTAQPAVATGSLQRLVDVLRAREAEAAKSDTRYHVPRFVVDPDHGTDLVDVGNPYTFYLTLIDNLDGDPATSVPADADGGRRELSQADLVYLSYLRTGAAFDGRTGTALSQLALLPHLRRLGVSVLLTLPTGSIGRANRKGSRGSPFAIADPFTVDASLADQLVPELPATTQYQALVEAAAQIGIRCGSIVPLATLALDSPLLARFPEITYWWDRPPGTPLPAHRSGEAGAGTPDTVATIDPALAPLFARAPTADTVTPTSADGATFWVSADGLTPATACPDVLAGDSGTYSWSDVAGVRFGDRDVPDLGPPQTTPTYRDRAVQIAALSLAWRAAVLGEQVFWVDVASRVPPAVLEMSDELAKDWDTHTTELCALLGTDPACGEHDRITHLLDHVTDKSMTRPPSGRQLTFIAEELYQFRSSTSQHDAVVGPWVFCVAPFTRDLPTLRTSMRHHLRMLGGEDGAGALFLAGLGDHDTAPPDPPLAAGLLAVSWLLPGGVAMLSTGHEQGSELVINKEFGFNTTPAMRAWRESLDDQLLPLFNDVPMAWTALDPAHDLGPLIRRILPIRAELHRRTVDRLEQLSDFTNAEVIGYRLVGPGGQELAVYLNTSSTTAHPVRPLPGWRVILSTVVGSLADLTRYRLLSPFGATAYASPQLADALDVVRP